MIPFKSIRVGPFDVAIKKLTGEAAESCLGTFKESTMTISMGSEFESNQIEAETLLHELFHAIYSVSGAKRRDKQERIVSQMSLVTAGVFRDNPALINWLKEKLS